MRFIEADAIQKMLSENAITIWTCEYNGKIIGALDARSGHINLMFVDGEYHRRGTVLTGKYYILVVRAILTLGV